MKPDDSRINELLDGSLSEDQAEHLVNDMSQNPEALQDVLQELELSDLMARTLSPARSDEMFMSQLDDLLDGGMGENPADDGGDGDTPPDTSGPETPPVDPGTSTGLTTTTKIWAGIVLSTCIAGAVLVMNLPDETPPSQTKTETPPPSTQHEEPAPAPTHFDIIAEADTALHVSTNDMNNLMGKQNYMALHTVVKRGEHCGAVIRFDLSDLPDNAERIFLRLRTPKVDKGMTPVSITRAEQDDWDEATITGVQAIWGVPGKPLATFMPIEKAFTNIDLTDAVLSEKSKEGKLTLRFDVLKRRKNMAICAIWSREHKNPDYHPRLRVRLNSAELKEAQ